MRGLGPVVLAAAFALTGCTGQQQPNSPGPTGRTLPASQSPERSCDIPAPLPEGGITAVDTSVTPRANLEAEILALEASGQFIAPEELYQRVAYELAVIRSQWPAQAAGRALGCGVPHDLLLGLTEAGAEQVAAGQYTAWDDFNATLRLVSSTSILAGTGRKLKFEGVYNHATMAQEYAQLPEIRWAESNGYVGASSGLCLEQLGDAQDTHVYIFWQGSGDCQAGCIDKQYAGFAAAADGATEWLGAWNGRGDPPAWFTGAAQCRNFL